MKKDKGLKNDHLTESERQDAANTLSRMNYVKSIIKTSAKRVSDPEGFIHDLGDWCMDQVDKAAGITEDVAA